MKNATDAMKESRITDFLASVSSLILLWNTKYGITDICFMFW